MTIDFTRLKEPFPKDKVSWRAQTVNRKGDKALALAYIDARDVYDRLDEVCGPDGWRNRYIQEKDRTYCEIDIKCGGEWVSKSNAAGDTAVEKEKGAASDALKRAAVAWGIGRYLYDFENVWVPCESRDDGKDNHGNTKWRFVRFVADPWQGVRNPAHFLPSDGMDGEPQKQPTNQQNTSNQNSEFHPVALQAAERAGVQDPGFLIALQALLNERTETDLGVKFANNLEAAKAYGDAALEQYKAVNNWCIQRFKGRSAA